jgi:PhoH-like ATPase
MKIKDLEIGKVYYVSDDDLNIKTSPKIRLLAKEKTQYLFDSGIIEFAPMAFIRGRTFNNAFLYYDECQNISIHELKSSVTRAGYKSKVVVAGDWDQVDNFRIDKYSCGLAHVIQAFKGQKIFGHCNMVTSERSELAGLAAKLL